MKADLITFSRFSLPQNKTNSNSETLDKFTSKQIFPYCSIHNLD